MRAIFIAGTDTGVGKTAVSGLLGRYLLGKGCRAVTQKWIQTGNGNLPNDIDTHLDWMKMRRADYDEHVSSMEPYTFRFAASPHLASRLEKRKISMSIIKKSFDHLSKHFDYIIIEGSGGLLVPLGGRLLLIDLIRQMRLRVLLIAGNRLGAINSTLLSVEALKSRRIPITGIIFNNNQKNQESLILKDNPKIVNSLTGVEILGTLPYEKSRELLYKRFTPIGDRIMEII